MTLKGRIWCVLLLLPDNTVHGLLDGKFEISYDICSAFPLVAGHGMAHYGMVWYAKFFQCKWYHSKLKRTELG